MEKTESMHACRPQSQIARAATAISVSVFDKDVEGVRHFTLYLDLTLSSNLTWTEHVGYVPTKINQCLGPGVLTFGNLFKLLALKRKHWDNFLEKRENRCVYLGISPSASADNTFPDMHNSTYYSFLIFLIFWLAQIFRVISFITR